MAVDRFVEMLRAGAVSDPIEVREAGVLRGRSAARFERRALFGPRVMLARVAAA